MNADQNQTTNVELSISPSMIERVIQEWQEEHPSLSPDALTSDEFTRRMMIEIKAGARIVMNVATITLPIDPQARD